VPSDRDVPLATLLARYRRTIAHRRNLARRAVICAEKAKAANEATYERVNKKRAAKVLDLG
jgi:ribonuclease D